MFKTTAATRAAASTISLLLALQAPGSAVAATIARIVPMRTGLSTPVVLPSGTALPTPLLSSLQSPLLSPSSMVPSLAPSPLIAHTAAPLTAANPIAAVSAMAAGMTNEVSKVIEALGPVSQASTEGAQSFGSKMHGILTGEHSRVLSASAEVPVEGTAPKNDSGLARATTPAQRMMLRTLDQVAAIYTEHYAPIEWKQKQMGVDLKKEYQQARAKVLAAPDMTNRQFQAILAGFVAATRDYHASIQFASTEKATLPITIVKAEGKYYLGYINREALPEEKFPFQVGDEVVEFGGKPVKQAVNELGSTSNTAETDARLSEMRLTSRSRRSGADVPQGDVALKIQGEGGAAKEATLTWKYTAEEVPLDIPVRDGGVGAQSMTDDDWQLPDPETGFKAAFRKALRKLIPAMAHPRAEEFKNLAKDNAENGFAIGGKNSFVPALGKLVWQLPAEVAEKLPFKAYIYKNEQGQNIGYIRVSDFSGDEQSAMLFAKLIQVFEQKTDGLVFDQVNNPGGSLFFMYALLSMLTDKPLDIPKHRLIVDENDAAWAASVLQQLADGGSHDAEESVLGEDMDGMEADEKETMAGMSRYAQFILEELKAGRRLTNSTALFGIEKIAPNSQVRYTKPLVVLVNELDFSCADFFPAILQDNKRATIFGVRTSGAGGAVKSTEFPNQQGIAGVNYTWTFAQRPIGSPIENLGITPDVGYEITAADLKTGFAGYAKALNAVLAKQLVGVPARVEEPKKPAPSVPKATFEAVKTVLASEGKELGAEEAAQMAAALAITPGSVIRSVERETEEAKHTLLSFGTKDAAEGYLLLGQSAEQTHIFWLSAEGEAIMAAQTSPTGELEEKPVEELAEALAKEASFWDAPAAPATPATPTALSALMLGGLSIAAAPLHLGLTALLIAAGVALLAYNIYLAIKGWRAMKKVDGQLRGYLAVLQTLQRTRAALLSSTSAVGAMPRQGSSGWEIVLYFKDAAALAAAAPILAAGVEGLPLTGKVATVDAIRDLIR